jgi:protein ImuB
MGRTACVDLPAFPLQLLLRRRPDWREHPAAVVEDDRPQARLLWVNERARACRVLPGMRYAAGLSLAGSLRAGVVRRAEIERAVAEVAGRLRRHSPGVEPAPDDPGVFWLDASGLERLCASLAAWGDGVRDDLRRGGFASVLAVGFDRFAVYALARAGRGLILPRDPDDERAAMRRAPLDRLDVDPEAREALERLGVRTLGQFLDLPPEGIARRFGAGLHRLHRLASGGIGLPVQPDRPPPPAVRRLVLEHAEADRERLLAAIDGLLAALLETLAGRGHALARLRLRLRFERLGERVERLRPAEPTGDRAQILHLIRLRLESAMPGGRPDHGLAAGGARCGDGVEEVELEAEGVPPPRAARDLLAGRPRRDPAAADRALARIRADLGDDAVVCARLRDGHLPEARFRWEILDRISEPRPGEVDGGALVRRIYGRPVPLPPRERHEPDGWMLRGLEQGPVVRVLGPYVVDGGWWSRPARREYHFAETQRGELLWVYYDRNRRRWFLQGRVE